MEPRDFHIGTLVKWLHSDDPDLALATVFNCLPDPDKSGERILVFDPLPWSNDWGYADQYVHASDGAPLGEWVPLTFEMFRSTIDPAPPAWPMDPHVSLHEANAIIRGESWK